MGITVCGRWVFVLDSGWLSTDKFNKRSVKVKTLKQELDAAFSQADTGKGQSRHGHGMPFHKQPIMEITRRVGLGYPLGQAIKKIIESQTMTPYKAIHELHGAIVYVAAAAAVIREKE